MNNSAKGILALLTIITSVTFVREPTSVIGAFLLGMTIGGLIVGFLRTP